MGQREKWVDAVKGLAIYLMILGHSIQYASTINFDYANNIVFRIIYSFHMPLFMMMSGYLFEYSINKYTVKQGIVAKMKGIFIPCVSWGIVTFLINVIMYHQPEISIFSIMNYVYNSNWFLWAVLFTSILLFLLLYIIPKRELAFCVLLCLNFLFPDTTQFFHIQSVRRLLLFFVVGIMINHLKLLTKLSKNIFWKCFAAIFCIYCVLMIVAVKCGDFSGEYVCLLTGVSDAIVVIRNQIIQLTGCLCVILIIYKVQEKMNLSLFCKMGEKSIVLYIFSGLIFFFLIKDYCRITENYQYRYRIIYVVLISIVITIISYVVAVLLNKNKWLRKIFLGKE